MKTMHRNKTLKYLGIVLVALIYTSCSVPNLAVRQRIKQFLNPILIPKDSVNTAKTKWKDFFTDPSLRLLDTAVRQSGT